MVYGFVPTELVLYGHSFILRRDANLMREKAQSDACASLV